jgi:methionyl-tRNA synthetase
MLIAAGVPVPHAVLVHGMITSGGKKMSKTMGNVLDPSTFVERFSAEALRYYLARHISSVEDTDMTEAGFTEAYNSYLANGIGNLTSRVMKMVERFDVEVEPSALPAASEVLDGEDIQEYHDAFKNVRIDKAADVVWGLIAFMDAYIAETEPFKTIEEDEEKARQDILWEVSVLLSPFMPETAETIQRCIEEKRPPETPLFRRVE